MDMVVGAEINHDSWFPGRHQPRGGAEWLVAAWEPAGVVNFAPTTISMGLVSILPYYKFYKYLKHHFRSVFMT